MRVLLLRPPRCHWPFNSEHSAYWQPLGLLCIAAAVRRALPDVHLEVWDAPGERCGWRTLTRRLRATSFDVLGIGEETASAHEGLRAAAIVRQAHPDCLIVAGGTHYPYVADETLATGCVDVIVCGEGEETFVELLRRAGERSAWRAVAGLVYRDAGGACVRTPARPLIEDLDALPRPAYDLVDMSHYGRGARNHPALVALEHSRGCVDACSFCILWRHMGASVNGNGQVRPCYRTKSPARSFDEVRWLYHTWDRRTFGWVDPTFNARPEWSDAWAEHMLRSELMDARGRPRTLHTAWLRADCTVRDERLGVLRKLVRTGLRQVVIGLERDDDAGLRTLNKHHNDVETCREAIAILREKYPQVYTIGSVIFGLPSDTWDDLGRLMRYQEQIGVDYCFIIPLTPNPGTSIRAAVAEGGHVGGAPLSDYNFHTPVCTTDTLDRRALGGLYWRTMLRMAPSRLAWAARQFLFNSDARKRRVSLALSRYGTQVAITSLLSAVFGRRREDPFSFARKPPWYDH